MASASGSRPRTAPGLWGFIDCHFGVKLPWRSFTPGHSSPFAFVADCFFHPGDDVAAWSCRSGGKTLGASIVATLEFAFTDGLQARVLAGSERQARCLYEYWQRWCRSVLSWRGPRLGRSVALVGAGRLEILAASHKHVRGPKVHRLFEDELDEVAPEIDQAAAGMLAGRPGLPTSTRYTSTLHRVGGPMARLLEAMPGNGVRLHRWNVWEAIDPCPRDRHQDGKGCEHCPLEAACRGKAREYHADCDWPVGIAAEKRHGLCRIDDVVKAYRKVGRATWEAEYECKRPNAEGLVYPDFDEHAHRCERPPADLAIYRAIDWGFDTFVCLWLGVDCDGVVYLLDTYKAARSRLKVHADYILAHRLQNVRATYCDPAGRNRNDQTGRSNVEEFRAYGIDCTYRLSPAAREVANGIQLVRAALRPASDKPRFYYVPNENNRAFVRDILSYRNRKVNDVYIDEPVDPQPAEHTMDALRYFFVNRVAPREVRTVAITAS